MFIIGGLSGVMHASPPTDLQQTDSYFIVAHFHYVLFGGSIMGLFSGIYYWFPKITGRKMNEALGTWHFWSTLIGFNLTFFPMHFSGMWGMMRRTYTYPAELGVTELNEISTIGAFTLAIGVLLFIINVLWSVRNGPVAGMNPWDGATLEWSIPSPPPEYNFREVPVVHSRTPLWEDEHGSGTRVDTVATTSRVMIAGQELFETELPDDQPPVVVDEAHGAHGGHGIHMPNPSYYPSLAALGMFIVFSGLLLSPVVSVCGLALLLFSIYGWCFEPAA
jgi:cytochrome c oxidase subunit I